MLSLNPLKFMIKALNLDGESFKFNWGAAIAAGVNAWTSTQAGRRNAVLQRESMAMQRELAKNTLDEQKRQYDTGQENLAPYRQAGSDALGTYQDMLSNYSPAELPQFNKQYQDPGAFQGVTNLQQDPGYQFRLDQGLQSLDRMASRGGERYSGKRGIALQQYGQQMASQEYSKAYSRSLQKYGLDVQRADSSYGRDLGKYSLDYQYSTNKDKGILGQLSMYANLAGSGQQAAGASSTLGANYANQVGNTNANLASGLASGYTNISNTNMAASLGTANAINSGIAAYNYNQGRQEAPNYNTNYNPQSGSGSQGNSGYSGSQYDVYQGSSPSSESDFSNNY